MITELQNVLHQGGFVLWALLALGVGLYSMLAVTWFGLQKVKKEVASILFEQDQEGGGIVARWFGSLLFLSWTVSLGLSVVYHLSGCWLGRLRWLACWARFLGCW
jgi:hypothetical protein